MQTAAQCRRFAVGMAGRDIMADRRGLRLVGIAYGGVVAIVALIALIVVTSHVNMAVEARPDALIAAAR
jgi:hypothetical protein